MPTEAQVSSAFNAWEKEARKWSIIDASPWWLVEPRIDFAVSAGEATADEVAYYKFNNKAAAQMFVRNKIIRAILTAAETV